MNLNFRELRLLSELHRQSVDAVAMQRLEEDPAHRRWCAARRITWMILLAGAFLFFYLMHKMHEALMIL